MNAGRDDLDRAAELIQKCLDAIIELDEPRDPRQRGVHKKAIAAALDTRTAIYQARKKAGLK